MLNGATCMGAVTLSKERARAESVKKVFDIKERYPSATEIHCETFADRIQITWLWRGARFACIYRFLQEDK